MQKSNALSDLKYIYLDMMAWVRLSRAFYGQDDRDEVKETIELCIQLSDAGKVIFPLSSAHVMEVSKRNNRNSRRRMAYLMVKLSRGIFIAPSHVTLEGELSVAVAKLFNVDLICSQQVIFKQGIDFGFGHEFPVQRYEGVSEAVSLKVHDCMRSHIGTYLMLRGTERGEPFTKDGVEGLRDGARRYASQFEEQRLAWSGYSKEIRHRGYYAYLMNQRFQEITKALEVYGYTTDDFFDCGENRLIDFMDNVSTLNVERELMAQRDQHSDRPIAENDMLDIGFLSEAVPYCDVVITENFWTALSRRAKLDSRYQTVISGKLADLKKYLVGLSDT